VLAVTGPVKLLWHEHVEPTQAAVSESQFATEHCELDGVVAGKFKKVKPKVRSDCTQAPFIPNWIADVADAVEVAANVDAAAVVIDVKVELVAVVDVDVEVEVGAEDEVVDDVVVAAADDEADIVVDDDVVVAVLVDDVDAVVVVVVGVVMIGVDVDVVVVVCGDATKKNRFFPLFIYFCCPSVLLTSRVVSAEGVIVGRSGTSS